MAHNYRNDGPGGLAHVALATGILMLVGLYSTFPDGLGAPIGGAEAGPRRVVTQGMRDADCDARSTDTVVGLLGCAGAKQAEHLKRITLARDN